MERYHPPDGKRRKPETWGLCVFAAALFAAAPAALRADDAGGQARISYTRVLKGSAPEVIAVTVDSSGAGSYDGRKISDPPSPRKIQLSPATTRRIFTLAAELNDFQGVDLDSHKKVANLGQKTFAYEKEGRKYSTEFNYTLDRRAAELTDLFEGIASVEGYITSLEFAMQYDHLGLPRELLLIQIALNNKSLADPQLMIPALQRIVKDPRFLHLAQVRAQNILERVSNSD